MALLRLDDGRRLRPQILVYGSTGALLAEVDSSSDIVDGIIDGTYKAVGSKRSVTGVIVQESDSRELKADRVPMPRATSYQEKVADGCKAWRHSPGARSWPRLALSVSQPKSGYDLHPLNADLDAQLSEMEGVSD